MSPGLLSHTSAVRIITVSLALFASTVFLVSFLFLHQLRKETSEQLLARQFSEVTMLAHHLDHDLEIMFKSLTDLAGQIVRGEELLAKEQLQQQLARQTLPAHIFNHGIVLLDLEANLLAASLPQTKQIVAYVDSHHYQRVFADGRPLVGPPLARAAGQTPSLLPLSVPVFTASGRPLGVLSGLVELAENNHLQQELIWHHGAGGGYLLVDPDAGLVLAASEQEKTLEPLPLPGDNPLHDRAMAGYEGSGVATSYGVEYLASVRQLANTDWFVVARLSAEEAMAPLTRLQQRLKLATLLFLLGVGAALTWFIKRQFDPLVEYADTLGNMTSGYVPAEPLPVNRNDELGRLLHSFNQLLASIQEAEEKFRGIAEASLDLIFRIDIDGRVTYCSPVAQQIMGRRPEEIVGTDFRRHISRQDADKGRQAFNAAIQGEKLRLWEITLQRADGSTFIGEVNIAPIREHGRVAGVQGVVRDVTGRRRAAAALSRQLNFQKMVADISTAFIRSRGEEIDSAVEHALALSGGYFRVDRAYIFLFSADGETMSKTHEWCDAGITTCRQPIKNIPLKHQPWVATRIQREPYLMIPDINKLPPQARAEQEELWAQEVRSLLLLPLRGSGGQLGFMGYDVVRRDRSWKEEEITLINVVAECITGALVRHRVEQELQWHGAELARSNAELTDFAHIASHDLQEPLRKVIAFGDRLQMKCGGMLDERGRDYLGRMQLAAERMQGLIEDLLQYSRVTTKGREFESVDLNEVLRDVQEDLERAIEEASATIVAEPLPVVRADRLQMRSLMQNLLGNSLKYRRPEVPLEIRVGEEHRGGNWVEIAFSDNGIGFDNKYLDRIFRPFQRLHGRGEYQGSGIGLAVCKKIVDRHGGELTAHGTPGAGARFVVRLPRRA